MIHKVPRFCALCAACLIPFAAPSGADKMSWIQLSRDKKGFVLDASGRPFVPWGFNYDRDAKSRLLEDYWEAEWPTVEKHFAQMKRLGANVIRVHLQLGKFMDNAEQPSRKALDRLGRLLRLAEEQGLYLDLTGLGCYHKKDVPPWYDPLGEKERWAVQARFWQAVAEACKNCPAVFCYDLMNEPVVPGGRRKAGDWLGPALADMTYVQFIALDQAERPRPEIARLWVHHLATAIRARDRRHLITVGLIATPDRGQFCGFVPDKVADDLDFISIHLYPEKGKIKQAVDTVAGFAVGKPVVIEEMFPLHCSAGELEEFIERSRPYAAGWIGFYWGQPTEELRRSQAIGDVMTLGWLELFEKKARAMAK